MISSADEPQGPCAGRRRRRRGARRGGGGGRRDPRPGPKAPTVPTTTAPSQAAEAPTLTVEGGRARIQVHVDSVERQGDLRVVFYEVENTGVRPVDTTRLRAEVDDGQGRRFRQQPATAADTRGVLRPGEAGVITARFRLPAGAEPAVLYVAEAGGQPQSVAIP